MCAYWKPTRFEKREVINRFGDGINTGLPPFQIADSEATYLRNMDSREYPAATVRPGRSTYAVSLSTNINGLGQRNNSQIHVVDGNTWKYWVPASSAYTNLTTALSTSAQAEFEEFATGTNRYTILMNSTQKLIWDGTSTALVLGDANTPNTNIFTVHKGRIYAARDNDIMFCALNKTTDWTTAQDAGTIDITRAKGEITGLYEYNDKVIAFTEFSMHELFGTGPANYDLIDVEGEIGCISDRSLVKANRRLYWLWYDGVYEYSGSSPIKISDPVDDYIKSINLTYKTKCVSGSIGDFFYLSIPYGASANQNNIILKYDTRIKKWYVETGAYTDFVTIGNVLYGVDTAGKLWNMRDETMTTDAGTAIPWSLITKPYNENAIQQKKVITDLYLVADVSTGSTSFTVSYSTNPTNNDSTTFSTLESLSGSSNIQNERIQIPVTALQNVDTYRLKFEGTGQATIHYLQKNIRVKRR